jgi:hypothetical protein
VSPKKWVSEVLNEWTHLWVIHRRLIFSFFSICINKRVSQVPVAHAYNPGYLGSRDQEDCGSKPAWANSF